jgi:hypothetical protein
MPGPSMDVRPRHFYAIAHFHDRLLNFSNNYIFRLSQNFGRNVAILLISE